MPDRHLIWRANGIVLGHVAWLAGMVTGPLWAPWWLLAGAGAFVAALNYANRSRCPFTTYEYNLRRLATRNYAESADYLTEHGERAVVGDRVRLSGQTKPYRVVKVLNHQTARTLLLEDHIPSRSMIGRVLAVPSFLCGGSWYPSEATVGRITKVAVVGLPLAAYLREVLIG